MFFQCVTTVQANKYQTFELDHFIVGFQSTKANINDSCVFFVTRNI